MSFNKSLSIRRKEKDIFKLKAANYKVTVCQQESTYQIDFKGPKDTAYETGKWTINLYLPDDYPYKSPSVGFLNKIFHPNIDYSSGSVCLDVINQTWTPMYELVNIFDIFLPQLLTYPNPSSPLNHEAATLFSNDLEKYSQKVKDCIKSHALDLQAIQKQEAQKKQIENSKLKAKNIILQDPEHENSMFDDGSSLSDHNSLDQNNQLCQY